MKAVLFNLSAADSLAEGLWAAAGEERGVLSQRQFPDGESYVRLLSDVKARDVGMLCTLDRPDTKALALLYAAAAARDGGARSIGLVAPYLAYMRQDNAFHPGEAVTSRTFANLLSEAFDWIVTVDPHLHRFRTLDEIYTVPSFTVPAAGPVGEWIRANVEQPVIIGPDEESGQWVEQIARVAGAPATVLRKTRRGDYDVSIAADGIDLPKGATPVIVDDIASSARTMIEAVGIVRSAGAPAPVCVAVHAIFAGNSCEELQAAGAARIVSTNAVKHASNEIDLTPVLAPAVREAVETASRRNVQG
jgi:ribose-phosphate pyrophosphokinase